MHPFSASRPLRGQSFAPIAKLAFGLVLLVTARAAPAAPPLGLDDALARATQAAPVLRSRDAALVAARETAAQAAELPDPQLIVGIDDLPVAASAFDGGQGDMTVRKVGLMQAFPAPAKRRARRELAERLVDRAQALTAVERLDVHEQVARAWFAAWAAQQEVAVLRDLRDRAGIAVQVAEARLAGGAGTAVDAMAAQAAALEVDYRIEAAQAALEAARASLAAWLGLEPSDLPRLGGPPELARLPVPEAVLLATVGEQRRLVDARTQESIAEARVQAALADKRPDWSVMAAYGQRGGGLDDMLMLEARIDLPLFGARRQDRLVAARRAELQAATADRQEAERAQREAVGRALAEWRGLRAQTDLHAQRILPLADDRAEAALAAYRAGGPIQPWLDARRDELEAHLMHAKHLGALAQVWAALAYLLPAEAAR